MNIVEDNLSVSPWLSVEEVAERLRCSTRTVHELTRTRRIPHVKRPGSRRCLFRSDDLALWEHGAELDVRELRQGGRVVRPRGDIGEAACSVPSGGVNRKSRASRSTMSHEPEDGAPAPPQ